MTPVLPPDFDPDAPGDGEGLYGLPFAPETCGVQVLPVPWEATTSYGRGTAGAPEAVRIASQQVDLHDLDFGAFWPAGIGLLPLDAAIAALGPAVEDDAQAVIAAGGVGEDAAAARVDAASEALNERVYTLAAEVLARGAIPGLLGGDHSTPLGLHRAVAERFPGVGFLHIDAHADLRPGYLGFRWSHASIFHHTLQLPGVGRHVGVGWRDVGRAELDRIRAEGGRVVPFFDRDLQRALARGTPWVTLVGQIVDALPPLVHVSFDIDGLEPGLCPTTGTPVPGGLDWGQLGVLLTTLAERRKVVGFDLVEVGAAEWDANVGARVLFKLAGCALRSHDPAWRAADTGRLFGR